MRQGLLLFVVISSSACATEVPDPPAATPSVRERLDESTRLLIQPSESAGSITAERQVGVGWDAGAVDLVIDAGDLVVQASGDQITLAQFAVNLMPVEIPAAVFAGHTAQLTDLRVELMHPLTATVTWSGDNEVRFNAQLELALHWSLVLDGNQAPLGEPRLPAVPVEILLIGNGDRIDAHLQVETTGELWSWATILRLSNFELILDAATPSSP